GGGGGQLSGRRGRVARGVRAAPGGGEGRRGGGAGGTGGVFPADNAAMRMVLTTGTGMAAHLLRAGLAAFPRYPARSKATRPDSRTSWNQGQQAGQLQRAERRNAPP